MSEFLQAATLEPAIALERHRANFDALQVHDMELPLRSDFLGHPTQAPGRLHGIADWQVLRRHEYPEVLKGFIWAQTNAVEYFGSAAQDQGVDYKAWVQFKTASERHFDSSGLLLDAIDPGVTVVLSRDVPPEYWDRTLHWELLCQRLDCAQYQEPRQQGARMGLSICAVARGRLGVFIQYNSPRHDQDRPRKRHGETPGAQS